MKYWLFGFTNCKSGDLLLASTQRKTLRRAQGKKMEIRKEKQNPNNDRENMKIERAIVFMTKKQSIIWEIFLFK